MLKKGFSLKLHIIITKQNKRFVAYSPALDISTSGKTEKQVRERFAELAGIFIEELVQKKTITDVLSELGWKKVKKNWTPPKIISSPFIFAKIPVSI